MSLLTELQRLKDYPAIYGVKGPLGLRRESQKYAISAVETLADMASYALVPTSDEEEAESNQRMKHLLFEQEVDVTIHAYPIYRDRTSEIEGEEAQGIRGKIYLVYRDEEGREIKRTLWNLIVDFHPEDD